MKKQMLPKLIRISAVALVALLPVLVLSSDQPKNAESECSLLREFLFAGMEAGVSLQACFAPGTPDEYMAEWTRRLVERGGGLDYNTGNRWSNTANGPTGGQGDGVILTYSFVPDGTPVDGETSQLFSRFNDIFGDTETWQQVFADAFGRWGELTGNTYVQTVDDGATVNNNNPGVLGVRGDVRISSIPIDGASNTLAYNYFPNRGDMAFDAAEDWNSQQQNHIFLRNVCMHEHGHGLGIYHVCPGNSTKLMEPFYTSAFDGPQHDDRRAGQRQYGDTREPNDEVSTAFDMGTIASGSAMIEVSIDDNSDVDFYRIHVPGLQALTIRLVPVGEPYLDGEQNQDGSCEAGTMINSADDQNLNLYMYNSAGSTVLAQSSDQAAGQIEEIFRYNVPGGTQEYVVKVGDAAANVIQLYDLEFELVNPALPYLTTCPLVMDTTLQDVPVSTTTTLINPAVGNQLTISSISVGNHFSVTPSGQTVVAPGGTVEIEVTFDAQVLGLNTTDLTINHDGPGGQIVCNVSGVDVFATLNILTPDTLNYGEVPVNTTDSSHFVALQASGNTAIVINSVFATTPFGLDFAGPVYLDPGPLLRLYPHYTPTTLGSHFGRLVIIHSGPTSPDTVVLHGIGVPNLSSEDPALLPHEFSLSQNYPNPFNPETRIQFALPSAEHVLLTVYNLNGQRVATLADEVMGLGYHELAFNGAALPSGVYIYRLTAGAYRDVKKMVLMK